MCGIFGKLNFDPREPVDKELLHRMMTLLQHRGPDDGGTYLSGSVGLGHRRLSIIDLSSGHQPMCNEDGKVWVVYNGEIYNFRELRSQLKGKGHRFKSHSDTEVILHAFEEWGPDSVEKLRGMFAFALWDETKRLLLLARDRVGVKPLYYANTGRSLVFASEIKAILVDHSVDWTTNPLAVDRFLTYGYLPGTETLLKSIVKLEPGHYLTVQDGSVMTRQYWDLCFKPPSSIRSYRDSVEDLKVLLRKTVRDHMISDVPIGLLLSGGVDSTGVLRYAIEQTDKPIFTFTIGFSDEDITDERQYAKLASEQFETIHHDITISAKDFWDFLPNLVWYMEEPVFEPPAVALYYVARLAKETGVKVLLSGEGGDEAFAGYQNYRNLLLLERLKKSLGPAKGILDVTFKVLEHIGWSSMGKYRHLIDIPLPEYYLSRTETPYSILNSLKHTLYTSDFKEVLHNSQPFDPTRSLFKKIGEITSLNSMLYVDTKTWLPDDLLLKADKMTMATSVELRVPLLDHQILDFSASIPENFKVKGWKTKRILKSALKDSVPKEILQRRKTGFPVPYDKWLKLCKHDLRDEIFSGLKLGLEEYLSRDKVIELIDMNQWDNRLSKAIFCILILAMWQKIFGKKGLPICHLNN